MHSEIERERHRIESEGQKDCALSVPGSHPTVPQPPIQHHRPALIYQVLLKSDLIITNKRPKTGKGQLEELKTHKDKKKYCYTVSSPIFYGLNL